MRRVKISEIVEAEAKIELFPYTDPTNHSYREFVAYFQARGEFSCHDITIGAYMAYGWMPRALNRFDVNSLNDVTAVVNRAKKLGQGQHLSGEEMSLLRRSINNSLVGPSKLLHFVNPEVLAIWDSRVFYFIQKRDPKESEIRSIANYFAYHDNLDDLIAEPKFRQVHDSMNHKIGYPVTPMRACEYVMYMAGRGDNGVAGQAGKEVNKIAPLD
jgi:hypothetical protein